MILLNWKKDNRLIDEAYRAEIKINNYNYELFKIKHNGYYYVGWKNKDIMSFDDTYTKDPELWLIKELNITEKLAVKGVN